MKIRFYLLDFFYKFYFSPPILLRTDFLHSKSFQNTLKYEGFATTNPEIESHYLYVSLNQLLIDVCYFSHTTMKILSFTFCFGNKIKDQKSSSPSSSRKDSSAGSEGLYLSAYLLIILTMGSTRSFLQISDPEAGLFFAMSTIVLIALIGFPV